MDKWKLKLELSTALHSHTQVVDALRRGLLANEISIEQLCERLRVHSIELGQTACMPFREQEKE